MLILAQEVVWESSVFIYTVIRTASDAQVLVIIIII